MPAAAAAAAAAPSRAFWAASQPSPLRCKAAGRKRIPRETVRGAGAVKEDLERKASSSPGGSEGRAGGRTRTSMMTSSLPHRGTIRIIGSWGQSKGQACLGPAPQKRCSLARTSGLDLQRTELSSVIIVKERARSYHSQPAVSSRTGFLGGGGGGGVLFNLFH